MTPWEFYASNASAEFDAFALRNGAHAPTPTQPPTVDVDFLKVAHYICTHASEAMVRHYEPRPYMTEAENYEMSLPGTVGIGAGSSTEYSWGLQAGAAQEVKALIGQAALERLGFISDTVFVKLIVFMPGHGIPWHRDSFTGWNRTVGGSAKALQRKVLMLTPWHWGQMLQLDNTILYGWSKGTAYDIAPGVWHLSHNHGTNPQILASITGESR